VDIVASGGLDEDSIPPLIEAGADAFGVGTSITNAPVLNLAMDIVEIDGKPVAKRGKLGGAKTVWRCQTCYENIVTGEEQDRPDCPECGGEMEPALKPLIKGGDITRDLEPLDEIRDKVLRQLEGFEIKID